MHQERQQGSMLIAVAIGLGLVAIFAHVFSSTMVNVMRQQKALNQQLQHDALQRFVQASLNCDTTFNGMNNVPYGDIEVRTRNNTILIARPNGPNLTRKGGYWLRARIVQCANCTNNKNLLIESSEDRENWQDINNGIPSKCVVP